MSHMILTCNSLRAEDLPACGMIIDETPLFGSYGTSGEAVRKLLAKAMAEPDSDLIALHADGALAGFAWILKKGAFGRSAYLRLIAVRSIARGQGLGKKLLAEVEGRHLSPNGLFLLTTETNTGARAFYESAGYAHVGLVSDYVKTGLNECIYFKPAPAVTR